MSVSELAPVLRGLEQVEEAVRARAADAERILDLESEIAALRTELTALRGAVAHLRCSSTPLPAALRPVVARAVLAHEAPDPA